MDKTREGIEDGERLKEENSDQVKLKRDQDNLNLSLSSAPRHKKNQSQTEESENTKLTSSVNKINDTEHDEKETSNTGRLNPPSKPDVEIPFDQSMPVGSAIPASMAPTSALETSTAAMAESAKVKTDKKKQINFPNQFDILSGRGRPIQEHPGNVLLRQVVDLHRALYKNANRSQRRDIARDLAEQFRANGNRFLKQDQETECWEEINETDAIKKLQHCLRAKDVQEADSGSIDKTTFALQSLTSDGYLYMIRQLQDAISKSGTTSSTTAGHAPPVMGREGSIEDAIGVRPAIFLGAGGVGRGQASYGADMPIAILRQQMMQNASTGARNATMDPIRGFGILQEGNNQALQIFPGSSTSRAGGVPSTNVGTVVANVSTGLANPVLPPTEFGPSISRLSASIQRATTNSVLSHSSGPSTASSSSIGTISLRHFGPDGTMPLEYRDAATDSSAENMRALGSGTSRGRGASSNDSPPVGPIINAHENQEEPSPPSSSSMETIFAHQDDAYENNQAVFKESFDLDIATSSGSSFEKDSQD